MRLKAVLATRHLSVTSQGLSEVKPIDEALMSKLLNRRWMLHRPDTQIHQILLAPLQGHRRDGSLSDVSFINSTNPCFGNGMPDKGSCNPSFFVVRDDLLHPYVNGNKARKLDALLPLLLDHSVTDVVRLQFFSNIRIT
uniref:Uncharacterized protein n=1 Tax=Rhizophora mucronata TaxID=61149 RepID=A0A2P2QN75_RHIMU